MQARSMRISPMLQKDQNFPVGFCDVKLREE